MRASALIAILALLLGACSSTPMIDPPAKLVALQAALPVQVLWSQNLLAKLEGYDARFAPLLEGDKLFVADGAGRVLCLDARNGRIVWETRIKARISSGPDRGDGLLLFGTLDADVLALRMEDGAVAWRSTVSSEVLAPPRAAEDVVAVRTVDDKVFVLDARSGKRLWVHGQSVPVLTLRGTSAPLLVKESGSAGARAIVGFANGNLTAYNLRDGGLLWEARIGVPQGRSELEQMVDVDADPVLAEGVIYAVSFQGRLVAVDQGSGRVLWAREMSAYADFVVEQDKIYVTDNQGHVWALERATGAALWKQDKLHGRGVTAPALYRDYLVVGDAEGYVHWLARDDGRLVARYQINGSAISVTPLVADNVVYARGKNGTLEALRIR